MTRVETLREQASILRAIAASFDDDVIRADLLRLAERCEELATRMTAAIQRNSSRPIEELGRESNKIGTTLTHDVPMK
jgi:hypothetical protein